MSGTWVTWRVHVTSNEQQPDDRVRSAQDLEAAGYRPVRTFWHMEGDLSHGLAAPEPPPGRHHEWGALVAAGPDEAPEPPETRD